VDATSASSRPRAFPPRKLGERPTRSYKEAGDDERLFREICRHNLLVNMLSDPGSISEETLDIQADCVRRTRFNSRKSARAARSWTDLAALTRPPEPPCRCVSSGARGDDSAFRPATKLIGEVREAVGGNLDVHQHPARRGTGRPTRMRPRSTDLMLEFFAS
jgi:hypothetical protein